MIAMVASQLLLRLSYEDSVLGCLSDSVQGCPTVAFDTKGESRVNGCLRSYLSLSVCLTIKQIGSCMEKCKGACDKHYPPFLIVFVEGNSPHFLFKNGATSLLFWQAPVARLREFFFRARRLLCLRNYHQQQVSLR